MEKDGPLQCVFFETESANMPVRDFLLERTREDRKEIGADIFKVQESFPLGHPLVEKNGQRFMGNPQSYSRRDMPDLFHYPWEG